MTTESFTKHCDQFLSTVVIQPLAKFVVENHQDINGKSIDDVCTLFHKQLSLVTPLSSSIPAISVASALAPSMIQSNNQYPPIGLPTSPAPKSTKKSASTTAPIDGITYLRRSRNGEKICGYRSPRQPNKDMICGAPATTTLKGLASNDYRDLRCAACKNKIGSIMRMSDDGTSISTTRAGGKSKNSTAASSTPQIPGINIPIVSESSSMVTTTISPSPVIIGGINTTSSTNSSSSATSTSSTIIAGINTTSSSNSSSSAPSSTTKKTLDIIDLTGNGEGYSLIDDKEFKTMIVSMVGPIVCIGKTSDLDLKNIPKGFQNNLKPLTNDEASQLKSIYGLEYKPIN